MVGLPRVVRTNTGHLLVDGCWFNVSDVSSKAHQVVKDYGSNNPGFDSPPFCYTGCPYAEAILSLGCEETTPPEEWQVEILPRMKEKPWRSREPIWPEVFGIDQTLHES